MLDSLDEDRQNSLITAEEHKVCKQRLENLSRLQRKIQRAAPLAETFF